MEKENNNIKNHSEVKKNYYFNYFYKSILSLLLIILVHLICSYINYINTIIVIYIFLSLLFFIKFIYSYFKVNFSPFKFFWDLFLLIPKTIKEKANGKFDTKTNKFFNFIFYLDKAKIDLKIIGLTLLFRFIKISFFQILIFSFLFKNLYFLNRNFFELNGNLRLHEPGTCDFIIFSAKNYLFMDYGGITSTSTLINFLTLLLSFMFFIHSTFIFSHLLSMANTDSDERIEAIKKEIKNTNSMKSNNTLENDGDKQ